MKRLSFGAKPEDHTYMNEVFPALLKTFGYNDDPKQVPKLSTIRPAWEIIKCDTVDELHKKVRCRLKRGATEFDSHNYYGLRYESKIELDRHFWKQYGIQVNKPTAILTKAPYFKEGEIVRAVWKQRSTPPGSHFCSECGMKLGLFNDPSDKIFQHTNCSSKSKVIPKILGEVKITKVLKIEIRKGDDNLFSITPERGNTTINDFNISDFQDNNIRFLFNVDGFKTARSFFTYFDKAYDLSTPKPFYVYGGWEVCK